MSDDTRRHWTQARLMPLTGQDAGEEVPSRDETYARRRAYATRRWAELSALGWTKESAARIIARELDALPVPNVALVRGPQGPDAAEVAVQARLAWLEHRPG